MQEIKPQKITAKLSVAVFERRKSQLVVSYLVVINPCCGLAFCGFISKLIGCETMTIPEIFSGAQYFTSLGFMGKTVNICSLKKKIQKY